MKQANPVLTINPMNEKINEKINENISKPKEEDTVVLCCMCYCLYTICLSCLLSN